MRVRSQLIEIPSDYLNLCMKR